MLYWNYPDLLTVAEQATRVCQNNPRAIAYMKFHALPLSELFSGGDIHTALHRAEEQIVSAEPELGRERCGSGFSPNDSKPKT